jgi:hypothetical protein
MGSYLRDALHEGGATVVVACLHAPMAKTSQHAFFYSLLVVSTTYSEID